MQTARAFKLAFQPGTAYDEADRSSLLVARCAMAGFDVFVAAWAAIGYVGGHRGAFAGGASLPVGLLAAAQIGGAVVAATYLVRASLVRLLGPRRWPLMDHWLWSRIAFLPPFMGVVVGLPPGLWWAVGFDGARWLSLLPHHLLGGGAMVTVLFALALRRPFALRAPEPKRRRRSARPS